MSSAPTRSMRANATRNTGASTRCSSSRM
jgi:hypothetical protein